MTDPKREVIFHALDPQAEVQIASRNLPHWFQIDATIFVTFRTADSIPREVRLRWQREPIRPGQFCSDAQSRACSRPISAGRWAGNNQSKLDAILSAVDQQSDWAIRPAMATRAV